MTKKSNTAAQAEQKPAENAGELYGSSTLPAIVEIGDMKIELGALVAAAFAASGLTVQEWNALSEGNRDEILNNQIKLVEDNLAAIDQEELDQELGQDDEAPALEIPALPFMANAPFALTRIEQVRSLHELGAGVDSEPAPAERTEIHAFKAEDGRTLHVVMLDGNLFSQEI